MKNLRLVMNPNCFEKFKAIMEENYLYNYIIPNESELYSANILENPTVSEIRNHVLFCSKNDITIDDEMVVIQTMRDIKNKNIEHYLTILDTENGTIQIYKDNPEKILLQLKICAKDDFENINKLEQLHCELLNEQELDM